MVASSNGTTKTANGQLSSSSSTSSSNNSRKRQRESSPSVTARSTRLKTTNNNNNNGPSSNAKNVNGSSSSNRQQQQQQKTAAAAAPVSSSNDQQSLKRSPGQQNNVPVSQSSADNKNSSSSSTRGGGGAVVGLSQQQQQQQSNSNSSNRHHRSSSSQATVRSGDNNKPEAPPLCSSTTTTTNSTKQKPPLPTASAAAAASSSADGDDTAAAIRRHHMKEAFQPWVMQTYGDAAKTKTISRRKAERIGRILRGHDRSNGADSSKFRFWVRAKGFRLGPPGQSTSSSFSSSATSSSSSHCGGSSGNSSAVASPNGGGVGADCDEDDDATSISAAAAVTAAAAAAVDADDDTEPSTIVDDLYVVTSTAKDEIGCERPVYKRVAVVEDFFDIIYREHVEFQGNQGGRAPASGKHAGQKRTYRAITEIYAFLPREAVTRFLMQCADCQRRGGGGGGNGVVSPPSRQLSPSVVVASSHHHHHNAVTTSGSNGVSPGSPTPPASPASLGLGLVVKTDIASASAQTCTPLPAAAAGLMLALSAHNIDLSLPLTSTLIKRAKINGVSHRQLLGLDRAESSFSSAGSCFTGAPTDMPATGGGFKTAANQDVTTTKPINVASHSPTPLDAVGLVARQVLSPVTLDLSSKTGPVQLTISSDDGQHSPMANDDDDDDDDTDDRIDLQVFDPERLKAFNMFVRLFVDENLDRIVPISRQPREKIQAIIDSCLRQFPEFGERARKRIRTYLKSCRRNKRPASDAGLPSPGSSTLMSSSSVNRPMPPHLTSPAAEQILAQACENENQNAKRLRLGLEPISQPLPSNFERPASRGQGNAAACNAANTSHSPSSSSSSSGSLSAVVAENHRSSPTTAAGSNQLFRPAFGPYQRSGTAPQTLPILSYSGSTLPTDLSTKPRPAGPVNGLSSPSSSSSSSGGPPHGSLPHKLNTAEMLAVRQLITGYRESAAFLLRSADELEQLLHNQHSSSN